MDEELGELEGHTPGKEEVDEEEVDEGDGEALLGVCVAEAVCVAVAVVRDTTAKPGPPEAPSMAGPPAATPVW